MNADDAIWTLAAVAAASALSVAAGVTSCVRWRRELRAPSRAVVLRAVPQPPTYARGVAYDVPPTPDGYWPWSKDGTTTLMPVVGA